MGCDRERDGVQEDELEEVEVEQQVEGMEGVAGAAQGVDLGAESLAGDDGQALPHHGAARCGHQLVGEAEAEALREADGAEHAERVVVEGGHGRDGGADEPAVQQVADPQRRAVLQLRGVDVVEQAVDRQVPAERVVQRRPHRHLLGAMGGALLLRGLRRQAGGVGGPEVGEVDEHAVGEVDGGGLEVLALLGLRGDPADLAGADAAQGELGVDGVGEGDAGDGEGHVDVVRRHAEDLVPHPAARNPRLDGGLVGELLDARVADELEGGALSGGERVRDGLREV